MITRLLLVVLLIVNGLKGFEQELSSSSLSMSGNHGKNCEPITMSICQGLEYNKTTYPNLLGHQTQSEAFPAITQFNPLIKVKCSEDIRLFLCTVYAPVCTVLEQPIQPCRELCLSAKNGCESLMKKFGFQWPDQLECSKFPLASNNLCVGKNKTSSGSTGGSGGHGFSFWYSQQYGLSEPLGCASRPEELVGVPAVPLDDVVQRAQVVPGRRRGQILVAIMTAAKYVDTRAYNVWRTWAQHIPGRVLFFVSEGTQVAHPEMPLIWLKGVDDTYPPQKKSFAMVKWLAENMVDDYDWFVRADDDLYIRGEELSKFLRSVDSSRAHTIGQAGLGNSAEYGLLALGSTDNYCMGGPGVVMSRATLLKLSPFLETCLQHMLTSHEDVELGRCIRKHVGVACTWNYEMQKLFHNNQSSIGDAYVRNPKELKESVTLHPIKDPSVMRRVHLLNREFKLKEIRSRLTALKFELSTSKKPTLVRSQPNRTQDLTPWSYMNNNKIIFCADRVNCPRHTVDLAIRNEMSDIVTQLFDDFNSNARQRGRVLQFQSLQYAYQRVEPQYGVDYVLDMILWFKKFRPPHRTTLSVRRHAYVQQTFAPLKTLSEERWRANMRANSSLLEEGGISIVLPLKGRAKIFERFAQHLTNVCASGGTNFPLSITIVLYSSDDEAQNRATITSLRESGALSVFLIEMGDEPFSRGISLMVGAQSLPDNALLFFTDVDMIFTCDALHRIRLNTILNAQVYFPIVFSEFSPEAWSEKDRLLADPFHYGRRRGYFRFFGYGLASMYKADLMRIGGFDQKIKGWGKEDVDLFEKAVKQPGLRVLRAPEPGLVHIYHAIHCDDSLPTAQIDMCHGSKAASLASIDTLVDQIQPYL